MPKRKRDRSVDSDYNRLAKKVKRLRDKLKEKRRRREHSPSVSSSTSSSKAEYLSEPEYDSYYPGNKFSFVYKIFNYLLQ